MRNEKLVNLEIAGIGIDIADVGRFRRLPYKSKASFYKKIFTDREIKYCLSKTDPYQHFAARFAAKEAIAKAFGKSVYHLKHFEILNDKDGKPLAKCQMSNVKCQILVSLSHTKDLAIAFALRLK